jgi:enolase-phosphatase E1
VPAIIAARGPAGVRAVLTDIEGTTTALAFVYEVLFPYAAARLEDVCSHSHGRREVAEALGLLAEEHRKEARRRPPPADLPPFGNGAPYARYLMAQDRKSTGLKQLQGLIWEEGYRDGTLRGHVFPDVPPALAAWSAAGMRLRVFSSGSVRAQRLLFAHTEYGDLTPYFEGFHDTTTGPKLKPASYTAIAAAYGLPPADILFLSDHTGELDAAVAAGMQTGLLIRPGNAPVKPGTHPTYRNFAELAGLAGMASARG